MLIIPFFRITSYNVCYTKLLRIREAIRLGEKEFKKWLRMSGEIKQNLHEFILKEASAPVLYLMGDRDHMFLPMVSSLVSRHFNSKLEVINNSGHVCNIDQPDVFNERSINFISYNFV